MAAAKALGESHRRLGAEAYISIARTYPKPETAWLGFLRAAHELDSATAVKGVEAAVRNHRISTESRVKAVDSVSRADAWKIEMYSSIALNTNKFEAALAVAQVVKSMSPARGRQVIAAIEKQETDPRLKLQAAIELGDDAIRKIARKPRIEEVRLAAVAALPKPQRLGLLLTIVEDRRETVAIRCAASDQAMQLAAQQAREGLARLLKNGRLPSAVRNHVTHLLR